MRVLEGYSNQNLQHEQNQDHLLQKSVCRQCHNQAESVVTPRMHFCLFNGSINPLHNNQR